MELCEGDGVETKLNPDNNRSNNDIYTKNEKDIKYSNGTSTPNGAGISVSVDTLKIDSLKKSDIKKDSKKIALLIYLYFLQGIPLGLAASMPFLLSSRGFSYADQGTFSFSVWPFSLKILWAPIVDSLFFKRIGRRKSWLVPVQFLMALFLFTTATRVQNLIDGGGEQSDIIFLTFVFTVFITLAATQDIAVDGWAISMLSKENVSWQSTCNFTGQAIGYFLGNIIFIIFESTKFSNQYIRPAFGLPTQPYGIITLKMFMWTFGTFFIVTTFMLLFFINEKQWKSSDHNEEEETLSISENNENKIDKNQGFIKTYKLMWKMLGLHRVRQLAFILLTSRIGWACDSALLLKMIERGVSKETIALLTVPLIPVNILWPLIISKYSNGPKSLLLYGKCIPIKLIVALICTIYVYFIPYFKDEAGEYDYKLYISSILVFALNMVVDLTRATSMMSFMARVSDESIGGTYMTFLNTLSNLGGKYPATAALFLINWLTIKYCSLETYENNLLTNSNSTMMSSVDVDTLSKNNCKTTYKRKDCESSGGECITTFDAFFYLTLALVTLGFLWMLIFRKIFRSLNASSKMEWKIVNRSSNNIIDKS